MPFDVFRGDTLQSPRAVLGWAAVSAVLFGACMFVNYLGAVGDIGVASNAGVSRLYPTAVTPAGYAFSIWGLIFTTQGLYVVALVLAAAMELWAASKAGVAGERLHAGVADARSPIALVGAAAGPWLPAVWLLESVWTFAFNYEVLWLSCIFMYALLFSLVVAQVRIAHALRVSAADDVPKFSLGRGLAYWAGSFSTAVNTGWVTVASAVNIFILWTAYGGSAPADRDSGAYSLPHAEVTTAVFAVPLFALGSAALSCRTLSPAVACATAWGLIAVYVKDQADSHAMQYSALGSAVFLLAVGLVAAGVSLFGSVRVRRGVTGASCRPIASHGPDYIEVGN